MTYLELTKIWNYLFISMLQYSNWPILKSSQILWNIIFNNLPLPNRSNVIHCINILIKLADYQSLYIHGWGTKYIFLLPLHWLHHSYQRSCLYFESFTAPPLVHVPDTALPWAYQIPHWESSEWSWAFLSILLCSLHLSLSVSLLAYLFVC